MVVGRILKTLHVKPKPKVGDVQIDRDGEWVIVSPSNGRLGPSRVRRNSLAHHVHADGNEAIAKSLDKDEDGPTAAPPESSFDATKGWKDIVGGSGSGEV